MTIQRKRLIVLKPPEPPMEMQAQAESAPDESQTKTEKPGEKNHEDIRKETTDTRSG